MGAEEIWDDAENSPVGMRVLAVDDDPICLKLLDTLLRTCHYKVTTTKEARTALKMIREEKDRFDLVISDVHMPDMDGFKLLELVGLEMDLPVIMLSANSDPKLVMKGVIHGACDYLVKPVRIEELRNIWQHVIRRKKFDPENQNRSSDEVKAHQGSGEGYGAGNHDNNGKFHKKRKDSEDETVDSENECEDSGKQKKIRVHWTRELHSQFIAAVNQLGIEKAFPKRILDIMKVEGLTRENVASHLQKYRLSLRKIASEQANIAAAPGVKDTRFTHLTSSNGCGNFQPSFGSKLYDGEFSPYTNNGVLSQLNSFGSVDLRNLTPHTPVWPSRAQNLNNSINSLGRMHLVRPNSAQNPSVFQEIPSSIKLDQLQQNEGPSNFNRINNSRIFRTGNVLADTRAALGSSNPLMLHGDAHLPLNGKGFVNQSTHEHDETPFTSESFNAGFCSDNWQNFFEPSKIHPIDLSPGMELPPFEDSREREMQCQYWAEERGNYAHSFHMPTNETMPNLDRSNDILNEKMDMYINGRSSGSGPDLMQQNPDREVVIESRLRSNEDSLFEQPMLQGGFSPQYYDTLDELTNALIIPVDDSHEYFAESGLHHHRL